MTQPRLGVLAVCLTDTHALLVKRKNPPDAGLWGFPGGKVEWGETVAQAALRELAEETGVRATAGATIDSGDFLTRDAAGGTLWHYYLVAIACHADAPQPQAADDASDARMIPFEDIEAGRLPMSAGVKDLLIKARACFPAAQNILGG
ncbi:NUDIX hydrolase [Thioclava litoralis]|uniref:NUDIX hydrolase n=1 Tax=Thioclava litoralis TaxID=3076557 RepID=A0ABZ1DYU0_9RHOB|nr:NUDIX hydrolase [Thioclava sp. FTW29]